MTIECTFQSKTGTTSAAALTHTHKETSLWTFFTHTIVETLEILIVSVNAQLNLHA